jgi:hypothetical protein
MKTISTFCITSAAALTFTAGGHALAQVMDTPLSPYEAGLADWPGDEPAAGPTAPGQTAQGLQGGQGGTMAPETGGAVRIEGGSATSLPMTPDSDPDYNRNGD